MAVDRLQAKSFRVYPLVSNQWQVVIPSHEVRKTFTHNEVRSLYRPAGEEWKRPASLIESLSKI